MGVSDSSGFASTQWSVVLSAAEADPAASREALETLCRRYWQPLYRYALRCGRSREDAEDLIQGFFASFLAGDALAMATPEKGRFRAYLLASLKHYICNEWKRQRRQKRGGEFLDFSVDWQSAEARFDPQQAQDAGPDRLYDREWALHLLDRVLQRLRQECEAGGDAATFDRLKGFLAVAGPETSYDEAAVAMHSTPGALRVAVHRLRKRYRALLREEVAATLVSPDQVDNEMRALMAALLD
jgi:RNA polymerase sigma factor (sigma-70 family)